jgi:hypothetical protein
MIPIYISLSRAKYESWKIRKQSLGITEDQEAFETLAGIKSCQASQNLSGALYSEMRLTQR